MHFRYCKKGCLDKKLVKGSYVLCNSNSGDYEAYGAGALGAVVRNEPYIDYSDIVALPALLLNAKDHDLVWSYVKSEAYYFLQLPIFVIRSLESLPFSDYSSCFIL